MHHDQSSRVWSGNGGAGGLLHDFLFPEASRKGPGRGFLSPEPPHIRIGGKARADRREGAVLPREGFSAMAWAD